MVNWVQCEKCRKKYPKNETVLTTQNKRICLTCFDKMAEIEEKKKENQFFFK